VEPLTPLPCRRLQSEVATFPPPPPTPCDEHPAWTEEVWASPLDVKRRVFCNRSLNMKSIKAIGFDMDYTLAQYRPETFEALAHAETIKKLVKAFGYPEVRSCLSVLRALFGGTMRSQSEAHSGWLVALLK
jgi:5' nucleotidase family